MAKAQYHKNQRVFVKPIGTWALVERVVPHWTKGLEEPIRVLYDVGLGREFGADELQADGEHRQHRRRRTIGASCAPATNGRPIRKPRTIRFPAPIRWCMTGEAEWGGWRVPGSEYALSPTRIEKQARLIAHAPRLAALRAPAHAVGETGAGPGSRIAARNPARRQRDHRRDRRARSGF